MKIQTKAGKRGDDGTTMLKGAIGPRVEEWKSGTVTATPSRAATTATRVIGGEMLDVNTTTGDSKGDRDDPVGHSHRRLRPQS